MDFYLPESRSSFLIGLTKWWWLPDEKGGTTLVVSVKKSDAEIWVVAYTILVGLIFTAACYLATAIVLTTFRLGTSGTRQAILVSYYNGGGPSGTILPMIGYVWNALRRCRRGGKPAVDWETFRASSGLLLLAVSLLSADVITKFFLGGKALVVANIAQANPEAIFYPAYHTTDTTGTARISSLSIVDAVKTLVPEAIYQANARKTNAQQRISERVNFKYTPLPDGQLLSDGSRQNGTGARFTYEYSITGFEMGLRDAPKLVYRVRGACATYHGSDGIISDSFIFPDPGGPTEYEDIYPFPGAAKNWVNKVYLSRENYTAPWAAYLMREDAEVLKEEPQYGGYAFMIVPHVAWRQCIEPSSKPDPWYETEPNPTWVEGKNFNPRHRVKSARPALRCTQNDTFTHNGKTVNHVDKLEELPGLKLSRFLRTGVFGVEFGAPVFSKILGNLPFGVLASTRYFNANRRELDITRISLEDDIKGLLHTSFVYSREAVRNTVLLYSSLKGRNDSEFTNRIDTMDDLAGSADFFLEGTEVAAMSVFVMVVTPCVCALLWFLLFAWKNLFIPGFHLDNKSTKARHGIRNHAYRAVHLLCYLDEELSRVRKYSGRDTDTPFIRDLPAVGAPEVDIDPDILPASASVPQWPTSVPPPPEGTAQSPTTRTDAPPPPNGIFSMSEGGPDIRKSQYPKPKVLPAHMPYELPRVNWFIGLWNKWVRDAETKPPGDWKQVEVVMARAWNRNIKPTKWENVRRDIGDV